MDFRCVPLQTGGAEPETARGGPGRPKLGVVAREVTLLPRHWQWLSSQPEGASVVLRKLVEEARRANAGKDGVRRSQEAANRFMSVMAGDAPGFEEAARALFAGMRSASINASKAGQQTFAITQGRSRASRSRISLLAESPRR